MNAKGSYPFLDPPQQAGELGRMGNYRVIELLGEGGMGQVFRALDLRLEREVALKVMGRRAGGSQSAQERFLREARSMAAVKHDNVATIYEVGEHRQTPYMAMELLVGKPLDLAIKGGESIDPMRVINLARQIARGLAAAHARGIIHRDVKPANIWIEAPSGRPKLLDFGLARSAGPVDSLSQRGAVAGTPGYLSPEQARDDPVDDRTDLYGLGVVLFELLSGRLPFKETGVATLLISILTKSPPSLRETAPEVPEPIANLVDELLAKEPRFRPNSAIELERRLDAVEQQLLQGPLPTIGVEPSRSAILGKSKTSQRQKVLWGVGALVFLTLAGVVAWLSRDTRKPIPEMRVREDVVQEVTTSMLAPIAVKRVEPNRSTVARGETAEFKVELFNEAPSQERDPTVLAAEVRTAAQIVGKVRLLPDGTPQNAPALPMKFSPRNLPSRGRSREIMYRFNTQSIEPGKYEITCTLQTPKGEDIGSATAEFEVERNLLAMDLKSYEPLRTWSGRGADITLAAADQDLGGADYLLAGTNETTQVSYVRFDLGRWKRPAAEANDAVLALTLKKDSPDGRREIQVWGVVDGKDFGAWPETGEQRLTADKAPGLKDRGIARYLGQFAIDNTGGALREKTDQIRFTSPELLDLVRQDQDGLLTLWFIGKTPGDPVRFFSKDGDPEKAPSLTLIPKED